MGATPQVRSAVTLGAEIAGVVVSEAKLEQFAVVGQQVMNHLKEIRCLGRSQTFASHILPDVVPIRVTVKIFLLRRDQSADTSLGVAVVGDKSFCHPFLPCLGGVSDDHVVVVLCRLLDYVVHDLWQEGGPLDLPSEIPTGSYQLCQASTPTAISKTGGRTTESQLPASQTDLQSVAS